MNFQSGDTGDLSAKALSRGSWPSSTNESRLWRDGVTSLLQDESLPSTGAEPGISVESNRCAALMAKLLAKAALAAQRTP
jgi:hypothetical protein